MKIVQNLIKVPPVNSEVLVDLKNIESPVILAISPLTGKEIVGNRKVCLPC